MPLFEFRPLLEAEVDKAGLSLPPSCLDRLEDHYKLLVKWNRAVRLVGDTDPSMVVRRHVMESLSLLPYIHEPSGSLLDIGSGNGFPAIPLKCALPEMRLGMLEPTMRKSVFLNTVVHQLRLTDCKVMRARVDRTQDMARLGKWDCITMRGVAAIPAVVGGGAVSLRAGGRILFMVGETGRLEVLRHLTPPLALMACQQVPGTERSYLVVVGRGETPLSETVH